MLPYVYRVTKYNPADRNEHGHYIGTEDTVSDHGPVEAAYLQAMAAFATATGVERLAIREPELAPGFTHFGLEPAVAGHGLAGVFPPDLEGFHDGAEVPVETAVQLVRAMLRDNGAHCSLEADGRFFVHIGWDQYMYIGSAEPCHDAVARARDLGLFSEPISGSPYEGTFDAPGEQRPADADFWTRLRISLTDREAALLEENHLLNASRWHRLTDSNLDAIRAALAPRARLTVWPDLSEDVEAVLAARPEEEIVEVVWEDRDGRITSTIVDDTDFPELAARLADARAAALFPITEDDRHPLFTAVLPDPDGVLRARWRTTPTPSDRTWAVLKTLRRGQRVTGTVVEITASGDIHVDLGGATAVINQPEPAEQRQTEQSRRSVGEQLTAEVSDVDLAREHVSLTIRTLEKDPPSGVRAQASRNWGERSVDAAGASDAEASRLSFSALPDPGSGW